MKKSLLILSLITTLAHTQMIRLDDKEIVFDTDTKQMWQDNSDAKKLLKEWSGAMEYCENLSLAGFNDWKLPSDETLKTLSVHKKLLRNGMNSYYWSSSSVEHFENLAWGVSFNAEGYSYTDAKIYEGYVRCVRGTTLH